MKLFKCLKFSVDILMILSFLSFFGMLLWAMWVDSSKEAVWMGIRLFMTFAIFALLGRIVVDELTEDGGNK